MKCATCGHPNPEGSSFCEECGARFERRCSSCGSVCAPAAKFCRSCGLSLVTGPADSAEARKVVTVVFADLIGSTTLHERLDPESVRRVMDRYYEALRAAVEDNGGTVVKLLGDGVLAAFGVRRVAEDDAIRAVRAAVAMTVAVRRLAVTRLGADASAPLTADSLAIRVGVNTGEVVVSAGNDDVVGDPVNVAARLQQEAKAGDVVIGAATRRLVGQLVTLAPVGVLSLKGRSETVTAYRVVSLDRPEGAATIAFVGRDDELRRIAVVYDAAMATPASRLVVVLGSPGLGKSRLLEEFADRLGNGVSVISMHCEAAGGATFAPLAKALRAFLRLQDTTAREALHAAIAAALGGAEGEKERIAAGITALLTGTPAPPEETFFIVRRFLTALSTRPVVLAIDDLQWAEPLLLDLVEHLVQWGSGVPLLIVAAARPELRDTRSSLTAVGGVVAEVVTLGGLDAAAAARLAANVVGSGALPAAVAGRVLATSEGNPLFLGELVRMLVNDGVLRKEGDQWTTAVALADLEMPPTIHALLAARIERLRPEDRAVLERAAVVGRQFSRAAVAHLLPREIGDLDARLEALRRSELIEPDTAWFLGEPALRFHHGLTRDAAYRRLLKGTRVELHGRFADWLESKVGDDIEHNETIGWHLEQAHQHLRELGPIDDQGRALGERAARYLAAAGRRALARDDLTSAGSLLGRAVDRLDAADPARADLALDWCEALLSAGDVATAAKAIDELARFIDEPRSTIDEHRATSHRLRAWHTCFAGQLAALIDPQALRATAEAVAAAADELASVGDAAGEAKAHLVQALALARLGKIGVCEAALDHALAAARRANDRRRANTVLANAPLAALWGPSPVTRASGRCLDVVRVLRITQGAPAVEAVALRCQAVLEALRGRTEAARRMIASSRRMVEELGITQQLLEADVFAGLIDLLEGDAVEAERSLRTAYAGLREHGLGIDAARAAAFLGRALLAQGRAAEAEALSQESEALAGDDLQAAITWRSVRAQALATRGMYAEGIDFARAAVALAAATDALLLHADARLALAAALRAAGHSGEGEADVEQARAIELCEAKGATLLAERARRGAQPSERVYRASTGPDERQRPARRRVPKNAAAANAERLGAAIAARDRETLSSLIAEDAQVTDHRVGTTYEREGSLRSWISLISAEHAQYGHELLATLGDSLALFRQSTSGSGATWRTLEVGAWETDCVVLIDVDAHGRRRRSEIFAADRLGDAVVRLFERYADFLDGPAHVRAVATAGSVAALLGPADRWRTRSAPFAPDAEARDHRTVGFGTVRGADAVLRAVDVLRQLSDDFDDRFDDVIELRFDALLVRATTSGTIRASGGAFEQSCCQLFFFGADGLVTRWEQFDAKQEREAIARFEELLSVVDTREDEPSGKPSDERPTRRLRPNAATAYVARLDAAMAARDADALAALDVDIEVIDHPTGTTYGAAGNLASRRALLRARELKFQHEPLATLGDSLALLHLSIAASGVSGGSFDVGAYERELIILAEGDADDGHKRCELFAGDRLGDAIVRLYERYAELLPDGPARASAAAIAGLIAVVPLVGRHDLDRFDRVAAKFAPTFEFVDHRNVGMGTVYGNAALREAFGALLDLLEDSSMRTDDVLALRPNALLVRWTHFGTDRAGGGAFERRLCMLWVAGDDGLVTRGEQFDAEREDEALARFDELVASPVEGSTARRPPPRIENGATRSFDRSNDIWKAHDWTGYTAIIPHDFHYVDRRRMLQLDLDRDQFLGFVHPLFEMASSHLESQVLATRGDRLALSRCHFEGADRDLGPSETESLILVEVDDHGECYTLIRFDLEDLDAAYAELDERYAAGEAVVLSPVEEAAVVPPAMSFANAATRTADRFDQAWAARDWERVAAVYAPGYRLSDRRSMALIELDREQFLATNRSAFELAVSVHRRELLATRGDRLAMYRIVFQGSDGDFGPLETEWLSINEVDAHGDIVAGIMVDPDELDAAYAELDERYVAGEAARFKAVTAGARAFAAAVASRDWAGLSAVLAPDLVVFDHRPLGWETLHGPAMLVDTFKSLVELAPDVRMRIDHITVSERGSLAVPTFSGTHEGGAFEDQRVVVHEYDRTGKISQHDIYTIEKLDAAWTRFASIDHGKAGAQSQPTTANDPLRIPPNSATRTCDRHRQAFEARDWSTIEALCAPALEFDDRRRGFLLTSDRDMFIRGERLMGASGTRLAPTVLATAGDLLVLEHVRWTGPGDAVDFEVENLSLTEVDADGRIVAVISFDPDDRRAASIEMQERYARSEAAGCIPAALVEAVRAWAAHDLDRYRAALSQDFVLDDQRHAGLGRLERSDYIASVAAVFAQTTEELIEPLYIVAAEKHGLLHMAHAFGTTVDGGAYEMIYVSLSRFRDGEYVGLELFEPQHLEQARARFESLRPSAPRAD